MDKDKIMDAMEYIDPALVEEAGREAPAMKRGWRGWSRPAVIAACLVRCAGRDGGGGGAVRGADRGYLE